MILPFAVMMALAQACAPEVSPSTLLSVVQTESGFDPLLIGVNSRPRRTLHAQTPAQAIAAAKALAAHNQDFDLGLAQVNSHNLRRLGLTLSSAVEPCRNLAAGAQILKQDYLFARRRAPDPQIALRAALSSYNTGDQRRGLRNGYVGRVERAAVQVVPALAAAQPLLAASGAGPVMLQPIASGAGPSAPAAALDVFAHTPSPELVWAPPSPSGDRS